MQEATKGVSMDYSTLRHMDVDEYTDLVADSCFAALDEGEGKGLDALDFVVDRKYGHADVHTGIDAKDMLKRMLDENKSAVGNFSDEELAKEFILNAIVDRSDIVASWFHAGPFDELPKGSTMSRLKLEVDMRESTGTGIVYTQDYKEYLSRSIVLVIDRNKSGAAPLGFSLVTAYPGLENATPTGRQLNPENVALSDISFETAADRVYAFSRAQADVSTWRLEDGGVKTSAFLPKKKERFDMYTRPNENPRIYYQKDGGSKSKISMEFLGAMSPMVHRRFSEIQGVAKKAVSIHLGKEKVQSLDMGR